MRSLHILTVLLFLALPVGAFAQARPATCEVTPLWIGGGVRSAFLGSMGRFQADGREGHTLHSFNLEDTKLVVTAGIDYEFDYSKSKPIPYRILLAITVSDKNETEIFESVNSSEAATRYSKRWGLSVTKNIAYDNRVYKFTLSCRDSIAR
jgi:hypothetical protein